MISKNSQYPIGLDISDLYLRMVQLKKTRDKIKIQSLGKIMLPEGTITDGEIKNKEEFKNAIHKLLSNPKIGAFGSQEVVASLPNIKTFIKLIEIEKSPNKIEDVIESEIEKEIPVNIENNYYDWQIIEEHSAYYKILVGVAPRNLVDQYIETLESAKLSIVAMEMESISITRALLSEESPNFNNEHSRLKVKFLKRKDNKKEDKKNIPANIKKNYGIIDIGAKRTKMIIYSKNSVITSISMPISGLDVTQKIAKALDIKEDDAEKAKIICGLDDSKAQGIISKILTENVNSLIEKIKKTIDFFESHYPNLGTIDEIIISGSGSNIKNLDAKIEEILTIRTRQADIFLNLDEDTEKIYKDLADNPKINSKFLKSKQNTTLSIDQDPIREYATAVGLALRNVFICNE